MASKRKTSTSEALKSVPTKIDECLSKIRENYQEIISNAEQEAITIKNEAVQRTEEMKAELAKEKQKRVEAMKKELAELEEEKKRRTEAIEVELADLEEEKKRIASAHTFEPTVTLNVGGNIFTTTTSTLTSYPDTMLGAMFSGRHALIQDKNGAYFIDRDGTHFREILNFLRGSSASTPESMAQLSPRALEEMKVEADFYGMKDLMFPFTPAAPVDIKSKAGYDSTITQGEDQLWHIQHTGFMDSPDEPLIVKVCDHCGGGYITYGGAEAWDKYPGFTAGRKISNAQPRPTGTCQLCKK